jgi:hypothetical protein
MPVLWAQLDVGETPSAPSDEVDDIDTDPYGAL